MSGATTEAAPDAATAPGKPTAWVTSREFLRHVTHPGHPERVSRLETIHRVMAASGPADRLVKIEPTPASEEAILRCHEREYVRRLEGACLKGREYIDCGDSSICPETFEVALLAAGAAINAVDAVMDGRTRNAFVAARPPGHHAERDRSMGFCMFGNVAVAARHLQAARGVGKVLILDWDVHHGNGTQHIFEEDPSVFFCSFHQHPDTLYPGTGYPSERGKGPGEGFTLNVTFPPGAGDDEYIREFEETFLPAAERFAPDFVLVSAGYDAHRRDPLGGIELTERGFDRLAAGIKGFADRACGGRLVALLEGGYDLTALSENVRRTVAILAGEEP
jgi:acetoin utilization deacetylase AcuC-like enzyme